jgi:hypothetical protein
MKIFLCCRLGLLLGLLCNSALAATDPTPLLQAHSHNDYEHARPLLDALDQGFCSVEADIWLVEGQLLVAHSRLAVKKGRTLQALYLDPLQARIRQNEGRVFRGGPPCMLLIDVKSDAEATYTVLRGVLRSYADILTAFTPTNTITTALTIVLSGNRAIDVLAGEPLRYAGIDGRLPDLETNASPHLIPLVSDNWTKHFKWRGKGAFPESERRKLKETVALAHQQGRRVRFWAAPDDLAGWTELKEAGVDLINTDRLPELRAFLLRP